LAGGVELRVSSVGATVAGLAEAEARFPLQQRCIVAQHRGVIDAETHLLQLDDVIRRQIKRG
jgi:hypothetical protein